MKSNPPRNQAGNAVLIVVTGLLIIIAAALIYGVWSSEKIAYAKRCEMKILNIQAYEHKWQTAKAAERGDADGLCERANTMVDGYNGGKCAEDFGTLPKASCD